MLRQIDPSTLTQNEHHQILTTSISPRPVAFVTTIAKNKLLNGAPFSYFNIVSTNPPLISLAVERENGVEKDTSEHIRENKEFVVHIVDESFVEEMDETAGTYTGKGSEVSAVGLTPIKTDNTSVPGIEEAKVRFDCILEKSFTFEGQEGKACDLIIGRIAQYHISEELYEDGQIDIEKLKPISCVGTDRYMRLGEIFTVNKSK